ncbi:peptidoglycan-binding domain-containing protein [Streptomyces sp. MI02-7b]|uniref:peptidoglycan-binding domain-containing protein n=1 Tax=Streptomyces sp. MI02-7b TaxID=462941 RepID=UPI0029B8075D|nr:peptidoglycan-binding domain-containing protein [Streptomyces sp. MI02-7b]MDX3073748.1 peptidoglycan-binding domain-containing protein [Streptomyces sp. MI02-7b]
MIEPTRVIPARESAAAGSSWEESLDLFRPADGAAPPPRGGGPGPDTQPLPPPVRRPAPAPPPAPPVRRPRSSRTARLTGLGALVAGAGAAGFGLALALFSPAAAPAVPVTTAPPAARTVSGVLREGDSGPAVSDLQSRLLRIPDVYTGGAVDGRFDRRLTAAVARFQVWYGIRGDESGEYGDVTRHDLESRTP